MSRGFASETPVVCVHGASWSTQSIDRTTLGALAVAGLAVDERPVALLVGAAVAERARDSAELACDSAQGARDGAELFHDCANRMRDRGSIWSDLVRYG
jgi:precorrin-4 methylase